MFVALGSNTNLSDEQPLKALLPIFFKLLELILIHKRPFHHPESTLAGKSLELTWACRRPLCPERPNLVRHCASGKNPCFSPSRLPFFLAQTVGPRSHQRWGRLRAAGQRPALSASMACFYLLDLIFNASMGQIRRLGGRKTRQKRQTYSIR